MIWAHAGLGDPPAAIYALMSEFPELYADTSLRERQILGFHEEIYPGVAEDHHGFSGSPDDRE